MPPLLGRDYQASISSALHRLRLHGCSGLLCVAATLVEVEIRELVAGRGDLLLALFDAVLPKSATAQADNVDESEAFLRDPSSFALGAYIDGAPVGLAWGIQMRSPSGRLTTYIHELDVHENWRRHGVGSALITEGNDPRLPPRLNQALALDGRAQRDRAGAVRIARRRPQDARRRQLLVGPGLNTPQSRGVRNSLVALDQTVGG